MNKLINPINNRKIKENGQPYKFFNKEYHYELLNEDDLIIFFEKYSKKENDEKNKIRELLLKKLINNELTINKRNYRELKKIY